MLLALALPTLAADLEVGFTTPDGIARSLTFRQVESAAPPPFLVQMNGNDVRVDLTVVPQEQAWKVTAVLSEVGKKGKLKVIASPSITVQPDEPGRVEQGKRIPIPNTSPVEYREESWRLDVVVRPS